MESPVQSRNPSFPWTMQSDPWETKFDTSSRCSSYSMKFPGMRSNDYDAIKPSSSSYVHLGRDNISPTGGYSWPQQPSGLMFPYPASAPHFKEPNSYRPAANYPYGKDSGIHEPVTQVQGKPEQVSLVNPSEPTTNGVQPNRSAKRHVKSACYNCKKAHLSCDEQRPCTRCKQNSKTSTCIDLPQRRKGRPRLRQPDGVRKVGSNATTKPLSVKPLMMADPRILNSVSYFDYHPDLALTADYCNDYSQAPIAFLDVELNLVRVNSHFQSIFNFLGDIYGRKLDHLVETTDLHVVKNVRTTIKQEIELMMSQSSIQLQALEYPDAGRIPSPEAQDAVGVQKFLFRREHIHFRFADGIPRPLLVEFAIARTALMFVTLTFPPLRNTPSVLHSHPQERGAVYPLQAPFGQTYDPMRNYYGRASMDRLGPLPSPDSSSYNISPSSSSFSFSSTNSSLTNPSRHASIGSHRSYEVPFPASASLNSQPPHVAAITLNSPAKQVPPPPSLALPQPPSYRTTSPQLAPLQDGGQSLLNSRRLPPIPGLGSQSSTAREASGTEGRGQQNAWPSPNSDSGSQGDKKQEVWRNENSTPSRSRLDMKELAA